LRIWEKPEESGLHFSLLQTILSKIDQFVVFLLVAVVSEYSSPLNPVLNSVLSKKGLNLLLALVENKKESRTDPITF
jgi:hypothetical protein